MEIGVSYDIETSGTEEPFDSVWTEVIVENYFNLVVLKNHKFRLCDELIEWLESCTTVDHCRISLIVPKGARYGANYSGLVFAFKNRNIALLFKLTWIG